MDQRRAAGSGSRTSARRSDAPALAERSLQAADRLRLTWKADSLSAAISKYQEAGAYARRAGDLRGEALAALGAASVFFQLSQNRRALRSYQAALGLSKRASDAGLEVRALNGISYVLIDLGKLEPSLRYSNRARALSQETGDRIGLAASLNSIGLQYYSTGAIRKSIPILDEAVSVSEQAGDRSGQAEALTNLGYAHLDMGDTDKGRKCFEDSLRLATEAGDRRIEALDLTAIALIHSIVGETQKALDFHNRSLSIFRDIGNHHGEAVVNNGIAYVYSETGDNQSALSYYNRSLRLFVETGDRNLEAFTMGLIGDTYLALGNTRQALVWCERRLSVCRSLNSRWVAAHTLNDIGRVYEVMGWTRKALGYHERALAEEKALADRRGQAYSLNSIGVAYEKMGQIDKALQRYQEALELFREVAHREGEIQALHNIAHAEENLGNLDRAHESARAVVGLLEGQRARVTGQEFRTAYFASVHEHYELYIDVLMNMHRRDASAGHGAAALQASEMARARGLLDMLRESRTDIREGVSPELLDRERSLQNSLNAKAARLTSFLNQKAGQEEVAALKKEITELTGDYDALEGQIRADSPRYAALTQPRVLGLAEIQKQVLDPDTLLLEYSLGRRRSYLWAVTQNSMEAHELPGRAEIEEIIGRLYNLVAWPGAKASPEGSGRQGTQRAIYELSRVILGPAAARLTAKRLVIVADGLLQYVPFAALVDPGRAGSDGDNAGPLAANHEVVSLPSVSVLGELRADTAGRPAAPKAVVVFADPVFDPYDERVASETAQPPSIGKTRARTKTRSGLRLGQLAGQEGPMHFARLRFAGEEAEEIASLVPENDRRLFLNFDANRAAAVADDLARYRIVHFATHAVLDNAHPALSGIVLSLVDRQGKRQDGFLRLNEIYNMKLGAGLVVLSACQTALGRPVEGEGLLGLTRGFMYAGAPRVVASLWEVDDKATKELMGYFYEGMLTRNLTASEALREAQMAIRDLDQWKAPYYWAGFVLQGDWR